MEGMRVLLVDDHSLVRAGIRALLGSIAGVAGIEEASSGRQAVALAATMQPDLVLMDIQLPDINGIEAFARIRANADTARVPVIAFTASVTPGDRQSIGDAGFDGFLGKPIQLKEFVDTVRRLAGEPNS